MRERYLDEHVLERSKLLNAIDMLSNFPSFKPNLLSLQSWLHIHPNFRDCPGRVDPELHDKWHHNSRIARLHPAHRKLSTCMRQTQDTWNRTLRLLSDQLSIFNFDSQRGIGRMRISPRIFLQGKRMRKWRLWKTGE